MRLFDLKNDIVSFSEEALLLKPFRILWDRDKSKNKSLAAAELSAIYFYADYKSDFSDIMEEEEKLKLIKSYIVGMPENWQPDEVFNKAVEFYKERSCTQSIKLLESTRRTVSKITTYLDNVDLNEVDKQGKLKFNVKQILDTISDAGDLPTALNKLEQQVKKELMEKKENIGQKKMNLFENGI